MSRYNHLDHVYGWDNPTQSFFYQKWEDDECVVDENYYTLSEMSDEVGIPDGIYQLLARDYNNRTEPTPLQKYMLALAIQNEECK